MQRYEVMLGHKMSWHWFNTGVLIMILIVFGAINIATGIYSCIKNDSFPVAAVCAFAAYFIMIIIGALAREHSYEFKPLTWYLILGFYGWQIICFPVSAWGNGSDTGVIIGSLVVSAVAFFFNAWYYGERKELFFDIEYVDE